MRTTTVIIGAGHAGLAMSRCLAERSIDHVVLERGEIANSWRTERWDSLRLLTPNWQSRLPGFSYEGEDPDGFRTMPETVDFIVCYARSIAAPVRAHTNVMSVRPRDDGYLVVTDRGDWNCRTVVLAAGACNIATVPALAAELPASVASLTPKEYRNPNQLRPGGVLVVGASATGIQLADEIHRSGRQVTLPKRGAAHRSRRHPVVDGRAGTDERYDRTDDIVRARNVPSPSSFGSPERRTLDSMRRPGGRQVGRPACRDPRRKAQPPAPCATYALADLKMDRLFDTLDEWAARTASRR
jgi:putative flavoprotein involved in K+ transport